MELAPGIASALKAGDTVIASSARAARALRRMHAEAQRKQGLVAWQAADILDWDSWLNRLWQKLLRAGNETRLLLSGLQEQQIWSELVTPFIEGRRLISVVGVSELAQDAWTLLCEYRAFDLLRGGGLEGPDVEGFRAWALAFQQRCQEEGWISRGMLPFALHDAVGNGRVETADRLVMIGFDRVTPGQDYLLAALRAKGHAIEFADGGQQATAGPLLVEALDAQEELTTCALWARTMLGEARQKRIGVVVPGLGKMRADIARIFRQVLAPESVAIGRVEAALPFEFSLGVPLAQMPVVRSALLLLRWMQRPLPQDLVSWLMLSSFVCREAEEVLLLASFDARLRSEPMRHPEQELDTYLRFLNREWEEAKPLATVRQRLISARRFFLAKGDATFDEWVERATRALDAAGWPGTHGMTSDDFQVQARWSQLLDDVSALAFDGRRVDCAGFIDVLEQQANRKIFAPESRDAPVQILGPFEAAGLSFDAVWFLGANDAGWPPVAQPHPFLSQPLQRKLRMPHANSDVDWELAHEVTLRLIRSSKQCVFSYALQDAQGVCRPSTLIPEGIDRKPAKELPAALGADEHVVVDHDSPALQEDKEPAAVAPWPTEIAPGGATVLSDQAACAFRSFAAKRLGARAMEEKDWGLDSMARGNVVHAVLESLWAELKDRDGLLNARGEGRLAAMIAQQVDAALQRYQWNRQNEPWNDAYLNTERARNIALIDEWLRFEEKRAAFAVEAREEKQTVAVGALQLNVRVDRVDRIQGGRVIIDYKTGQAKTDGWDGPRPDQPQLPLYAGYGHVEELKGILLAKVAEQEVAFLGQVEDGAAVLPGKNKNRNKLSEPPYTETVLANWRIVLHDLAEQFLRGEAQVNPKRYPKTCDFCKLGALCRVAESQNASPDDTDESNGDSD